MSLPNIKLLITETLISKTFLNKCNFSMKLDKAPGFPTPSLLLESKVKVKVKVKSLSHV